MGEKVCIIKNIRFAEFIQLFETKKAALGKGLRLGGCPKLPVTQWRACRIGRVDIFALENVSAAGKFMQVEHASTDGGAIVNVGVSFDHPSAQWHIRRIGQD